MQNQLDFNKNKNNMIKILDFYLGNSGKQLLVNGVIILGPKGSGKTYLIDQLQEHYNYSINFIDFRKEGATVKTFEREDFEL